MGSSKADEKQKKKNANDSDDDDSDSGHTLKWLNPIDNGRSEPDMFPLTMGPAGQLKIVADPHWQWLGQGCPPLYY